MLQFALGGPRFLMFNRERSVVRRHFSVVLAGNWIRGTFGTFFKHASTLDKVSGIGHREPPCEAVVLNVLLKMLARMSEHGLLIRAQSREVHDAVRNAPGER